MKKPSPFIAKKSPYKISVQKGKIYSWCSCGYSKKQPFCDGSHRAYASEYRSIKYCASKDSDLYFCGCKHTKSGILCDGSHNKLKN